MAKSLRSKWKKKMRAVKRVKYGARELERLKATVANDIYNKKPADLAMLDISEIATVVDAKTATTDANALDDSSEVMDVENKPKYNRRTMKDEHGNYPPWLSKKKIKEVSLANKKRKSKAAGKKKIGGKRRHR